MRALDECPSSEKGYLQKPREDLRSRLISEYLALLGHSAQRKEGVIGVGDVILIGNDSTKRIQWPLGIVLDLYPGTDGVSRVALEKTSTGERIQLLQKNAPFTHPDFAIGRETVYQRTGSSLIEPRLLFDVGRAPQGSRPLRCYDGDDVAQHFPVENNPSSDTETQTGRRLSKRTLPEFLPSGNFLNKEYQLSISPEATKSDEIKEENIDGAFGSKYLSRRAVKQDNSKVKSSNAEKQHNLPADYKLHRYEDNSRSPSASALADKITSRLDQYLGKHSHEKVPANGDGSKSLDDVLQIFCK
uniref:DUF5641 domain-containing protein n=1 Tax=Timema poppense TaxID=170557 RepID=A0A7R9H3H4_TIMPO|nr:unnamed protein product [Timema poppensis]